MAYTYATLQNAIDALDARLYNQSLKFWSQAELILYIREALRVFNALSGFWRAEMTFNLVANSWWYDLAAQSGSLVPYTVTQAEIIQIIQDHLLEPPNTSYPMVWAGSTQFTIDDLLNALQRRQDDTLGTTACVLKQSNVAAGLVTRTALADDVIDIRRVAWIPTSNYTNRVLNQSDFWAERAFNPSWTTSPAQPPNAWMQNTEPPISFDVDSVPPTVGQYDTLTVNAGPAWSAASGSLMNLPDDWTWVVKWGALADLLSRESNAKDVLRAEYAKARYQEGLALLENAPLILAVRIDNIPVAVDSLQSADAYNPLWQSVAAAKPKYAYTARNMMAFSPKPNGVYSVTASVCQNAPVPSNVGDYIQIAKDCYDSILDIAQHLAAFKMGGDEFARTISLYQKAQRKAAQYNSKLKEAGFFEFPQQDLAQLQEREAARYLPGGGPDSQ